MFCAEVLEVYEAVDGAHVVVEGGFVGSHRGERLRRH
jgi:hypothetical protein